jgi:uncharacterized tellurite resistance protein B-like protein
MGLFSKSKSGYQTSGFKIENEREAWITFMYLVATCDGDWSNAESDAIARVIVFKTFFDGYDYISILKKLIHAKDTLGENGLINLAAPLISIENKAPLLTILVDLVMADGSIGKKEEAIIEQIVEKLDVNEDLAHKIIEVITYKNKYGKVIIDSDDDDYDDD